MNKLKIKRKVFISFGAFLVLSVIAVFVILWFVNAPYRSKIPSLPNLQVVSVPLREQINDADEKAHRNPTADNLGMLGMVYHSCANYEKARECYKLAVKRNKSKWIWNYYLGFLNKEMGESETVISSFSSVIKENPKVWQAWYYLGEGFQMTGSYDQAEIAFSKIPYFQSGESSFSRSDLFPLETYAKFQIARIYFNRKNPEKAETLLKEIIKSTNSYGPAYRLLANVYSLKGDSSWSKYYVVRANDLVDYSSPVDTLIDRIAQISRSELYLLKQIDEAVKSYNLKWTFNLLNNALINVPDNKYIISKAVKLYLKLGNGQQAIPLLSKHLSLYSNDFNELKEVADMLYNKEMHSNAIDYYSQLVKLRPGDPGIITGKALSLSGDGRKSEAVSMVLKLAEKSRNNIPALKEAIYFLIVEEEKDKAGNLLKVLKQVAPLDVKVYKYTGMLAEMKGNTTQAIAAYEVACKKDPTDISTIEYLGNLLVNQNMWKEALGHFRKALEMHPNNPYLLERVGTILVTCPDVKFRNYQVAREFSERAFINVESSSETMISAGRSLGLAYAALGDQKNSTTYLNIALNLARSENYPNEYIMELENMIQ